MAKQKKETIKSRRENPQNTSALIPHGNEKLKDFNNPTTGESIRYAQINTRAILDCPFRSAGCEAVCYACKGNHQYPSVQDSRVRSYTETKREDYPDAMVYTIHTEKMTARFKNSTMYIRLHESGDFYSMQYLRKNLQIWQSFTPADKVEFKFYTKCFLFFLALTDDEKDTVRQLMTDGIIVINLSVDDTTTPEQWRAYHRMKEEFPLCNTYYCTEDIDSVEHDNVCDCKDCAECGHCNKATGKTTVVKIHSASRSDMETYRANIR